MHDIPRELREEFVSLACALSPENLTCDGELSRREVARKERDLKRQWKELERKAGRSVSEYEAERWMITHT